MEGKTGQFNSLSFSLRGRPACRAGHTLLDGAGVGDSLDACLEEWDERGRKEDEGEEDKLASSSRFSTSTRLLRDRSRVGCLLQAVGMRPVATASW